MSKTLRVCTSAFSVAVIKQCLSQLTKGFNFSLGSRQIQDHQESDLVTIVKPGS